MTSGPSPRTWSSTPTGGTGAERRSDVGVERVEDQVGAGQVARRRRLVAPLHDAVGADQHERALREAAGVQDPEGGADGALGLEVRELLDLDVERVLERGLRVVGVAGHAVERGAAL